MRSLRSCQSSPSEARLVFSSFLIQFQPLEAEPGLLLPYPLQLVSIDQDIGFYDLWTGDNDDDG